MDELEYEPHLERWKRTFGAAASTATNLEFMDNHRRRWGPRLLATLMMFGIPVLAEGADHKWLKIGQDVQMNKKFDVCVDQNGLQQNSNGHIQFLFSFVCPETGKELDSIFISVGEVDCSQDLSGKTLKTKTLNYREDGAYRWDRMPEDSSVRVSIISQGAIWACRAQKR